MGFLPRSRWSKKGAGCTGPSADWFMQEIDRVAMRDGLIGSDEYLERWSWSADHERSGSAEEVAADLVREIEAEWNPVRRREDGDAPRPEE